jgi:hypothetical protein
MAAVGREAVGREAFGKVDFVRVADIVSRAETASLRSAL